jgi:enolase-phosphatase E1
MSSPVTPQVVLTDIEGTTSSIDFVKDVLFPYARAHLPGYIAAHAGEPAVSGQLDAVAQASNIARDDTPALAAELIRWIDEDRKATPLKALQGMVWEAGYRDGAYVAHLYEDVPSALQRWRRAGRRLYVYSSGSIQAQKLFFGYSAAGDLTPLFSGYFDTTSGGKRERASYERIAKEIGVEPAAIVFLSDIEQEADAAREAGMATVWVRRDGAYTEGSPHLQVESFDEIAI